MDVFEQYATDETKEVEGVWCELGDGASVLVARAGNRRYSRLLGREIERNQRALDAKGDASDELSDKIVIDVMAQTILLDWKNLTFKREPLAYSTDNARKLLSVKDFRQHVSKLSNDFDAYRVAQENAQGKN
jgi:hypothetical protein